jgi:acetolactate synthase I/II/III large subunit
LQIDKAADLIATAQSPVIIAGGGIHGSDASYALAALQHDCSIPVLTTNMGKGAVNENHPLSAGVLGALVGPGSLGRYSATLVAQSDLIILAGTRTNQNGTDSWRQISNGTRIIHIDIDPAEIGRTYEALRLSGDVGETLKVLHRALLNKELTLRTTGRQKVEDQIRSFWAGFEADNKINALSPSSPIRPERVMHELQSLLTPQTTVVADASYSSMWVTGQLKSLSPGMRFITPRGLAGLGWGLPLALGARVARPDHPVVCIVGDGGFAHSWAELETMVRSDLPITIIVLNNGILGFQRDAETVKFGRYTSACHLGNVDHSLIAKACGCPAARISDPKDLAALLKQGLQGQGPFLLEIMTDPNARPPLSLFANL